MSRETAVTLTGGAADLASILTKALQAWSGGGYPEAEGSLRLFNRRVLGEVRSSGGRAHPGLETLYNRARPFFWTGALALAGLVAYAAAGRRPWGIARRRFSRQPRWRLPPRAWLSVP